MTQLQWTVAIVFACVIALAGAAWQFYIDGFTWRVAASAAIAILLLGNYLRWRKTPESA